MSKSIKNEKKSYPVLIKLDEISLRCAKQLSGKHLASQVESHNKILSSGLPDKKKGLFSFRKNGR
jgi:hypothetical protein